MSGAALGEFSCLGFKNAGHIPASCIYLIDYINDDGAAWLQSSLDQADGQAGTRLVTHSLRNGDLLE